MYFMGSETLPSACYILSEESSIPFYSTSNGYKNSIMVTIWGSICKVNSFFEFLQISHQFGLAVLLLENY